jgi:hypothetical protein
VLSILDTSMLLFRLLWHTLLRSSEQVVLSDNWSLFYALCLRTLLLGVVYTLNTAASIKPWGENK